MNYNDAMDELAKRDICVTVDFSDRKVSFQQMEGKSSYEIPMIDDEGNSVEFLTWKDEEDFRITVINQVIEMIAEEREVGSYWPTDIDLELQDDYEIDRKERYEDFITSRFGREL